MRTLAVLVLIGCLGAFTGFACVPGSGGCTYDDYAGTCTGEGEGLFVFEGTIGGEVVTLPGNTLNAVETPLAVGETRACKLMDAKTGTCTPCLFDIGEAGQEAWERCATLP